MSQSSVKLTTKVFTQSLIYLLLISVIFVVTFVSIVSTFPSLSGQTLYEPSNRDIRILTDNNFTSLVYNDERNAGRIQLIQFYNSWCGHCIAFAPTFKQLAKDCHQWSHLMSISTIDCAQDVNTKLCRSMDISIYPTLKLFWFSPPKDGKGFELSFDERTAEGIQKSIIKWITDNWSKGVPRLWPDLMPVSALSKELFIKFLPIEKGVPIVLIVENETSYLGRQLILDLSVHQSSVVLFRMLDSSEALLKQLVPEAILRDYKRPFMMTISNKDYEFKLFQMNVYKEPQLREMFLKVIKSHFVKETESEEVLRNEQNFQQLSPNRQPEDSSISKISNNIESPLVEERLYMSDLNNALRYSLFQEIALKKKVNSTQLNALKGYLSVLEQHFPFQTDKMLTFVKYLNEWLSKKKAGVDVDIEDMLTTMKIYEDYYHFPEMKSWKGCAGSDSKYRGYPCSVWTLFHTLVVSEHKNTLRTQKWSTLHSVLYAMRDYVKHFFGCTYCAQHFAQMAKDLESTLIYPNSSVLWLWRAHNKVNQRLKGDASEDPKHPKAVYPPRTQCPDCYENGSDGTEQLNEKRVLEFLLRHYSSDNIIRDESELTDDSKTNKPEKFISNNNVVITRPFESERDVRNKTKWNYSLLNGMDYSLLLFLYFSSAAIILTLCVYLKLRVRKRGQKYNSLKSSLSYA